MQKNTFISVLSCVLTLTACQLDPKNIGSPGTEDSATELMTGGETTGASTSTTGDACMSGTDCGDLTAVTTPTGDACDFKFAEEGDDDFAGADPILLPLRVEASAPVSLPAGSRLNLLLFGFDDTVADFPATLLRASVVPIDALPFELDLEVPNPPHATIPAPEENAAYYLIAEIDADGDDCVTAGDYRLDYDTLDGPLRVVFPPSGTLVVPVQAL